MAIVEAQTCIICCHHWVPVQPSTHAARSSTSVTCCAPCVPGLMPHDLPKWNATYHYLAVWKANGTWEKVHNRLRDDLPAVHGQEPHAEGCHHRQPVGLDDGKRGAPWLQCGQEDHRSETPSARRHVGTAGCPVVHPADIQDRDGAMERSSCIASRPRYTNVSGSSGPTVGYADTLGGWVHSLRHRLCAAQTGQRCSLNTL